MQDDARKTEPQEILDPVHIVDEEQLDDIAGGDGGQPSYPPYL